MKTTLLASALVLAFAWPADASEVPCFGTYFSSFRVGTKTVDSPTKGDPVCVIKFGTAAWDQADAFCDMKTGWCQFWGHVARKNRNTVFIDKITDKLDFE